MADYGAIGGQIGGLFGGGGGDIGTTLGGIAGDLLIKKPKQPKIIINVPPVQQQPVGAMAKPNPMLIIGSVGLGILILVLVLKRK